MKEQYDFGERKPLLKENRVITDDFSNIINQYDFVTEGNAWATAARGALNIANHSYTSNAIRGAVGGAAVGAAGNVVTNAVKRDDDPTKRGILGAAMSGAAKGATVGGVAGVGARALARSSWGKSGIQAMSDKAISTATYGLEGTAAADAKSKIIKNMNSGEKGILTGRRHLGITSGGDLAKAKLQAAGSGTNFDAGTVIRNSNLNT